MPGCTVVDAIAGATVARWVDLNFTLESARPRLPGEPGPARGSGLGHQRGHDANLSF